MTQRQKQAGFSVVELLLTLFVAGAFLIAGYQLYATIITNSSNNQIQSSASVIADEYLQKYKAKATKPCTAQTILSSQAVESDNLTDVTVSVSITCPYGTSSSVSKITSTVAYNTPQQTFTTATFVNRTCPTGFILVPGSKTYGTDDFCVMKYEAKADDNGDGIGDTTQTTGYNTWPADTYPISSSRKLVSTAAGYPVANISQTTAITAAVNYTANCTNNCHLITEAEWMTIAQNVLSVASNWSGGSVGSGYIYSGHNDNSPATALVASTDDSDGYYGTGNSSSSGANQRRTLTLTNGEVIWDMAGNTWKWTSGTVGGGQPGISGGGYAWREWTSITSYGSLMVSPFPSSTNLSGSNSWTSSNGIGEVYTSTESTAILGIVRGGRWLATNNAGILSLSIADSPSSLQNYIGFRVVISL